MYINTYRFIKNLSSWGPWLVQTHTHTHTHFQRKGGKGDSIQLIFSQFTPNSKEGWLEELLPSATLFPLCNMMLTCSVSIDFDITVYRGYFSAYHNNSKN